MNRKTIARFAGFSAGLTMALGFAGTAGAQTIADLQAQIAALMAQLAALQGGSSSSGAAITSDLTVGSTGAQVVTLQNALVARGHLVMPAGVAPGYFGALTKAAVAKWQAANGLPATGYFGPLSRAKFNAVAGGGTTTGGTVGSGGTAAPGVITTPGAEGDITVTAAPVSNSTVYEGADRAPLLAFKVEASGSDMAVQRVRVDLGTSNTLYRDVLDRIYVLDDANRILAQADLNNSTVVRNANDEYEITLTGFSSVVPRGGNRVYTVAADVADQIDSGDLTSYTVTLSENGVRAIDGAGIDAFDPTNDTDVTKSITFSASLAESASLTISAAASNPGPREVVAAGGSNENEADKVVLLVFDVRAEKDAVKITDINNIVITASSSGATAATASTTYLYAGNGVGGQLLATDALSGNDADFTDINYTVPANSSRTFTVAVDIRSAGSAQTTFNSALVGNTTNVVAEASNGDSISSVSGSATANNLLARNSGPVFTLLSAPTVSKTNAEFSGATSSAQATFRVRMTAVGEDVEFGATGSTTYALADQDNTITLGAAPESIAVYLGGVISHPVVASSTTMTFPSSAVSLISGQNSYRLAEGNSVDLVIDYVMQSKQSSGSDITSGAYQFEIQRLNWITNDVGRGYSTFMASSTEWRTPSVVLP